MPTPITLTAISSKGREVIRNHGHDWEIIACPPNISATTNHSGTCIQSVKTGVWRWFNSTHFSLAFKNTLIDSLTE